MLPLQLPLPVQPPASPEASPLRAPRAFFVACPPPLPPLKPLCPVNHMLSLPSATYLLKTLMPFDAHNMDTLRC